MSTIRQRTRTISRKWFDIYTPSPTINLTEIFSKRLFRTSKLPKRQAGGVNDYALPLAESGETSYLVTPHMVRFLFRRDQCRSSPKMSKPFPLDYHQTLLSLLDILSEVYHKISKLLGPSPFPHSGHMMGPLGVLTPHPGVSDLFQGSDSGHTNDGHSGSLWGIANGTHITNGITTAAHMSPPATWTPALNELVIKIDGKLKVKSILPIWSEI